MKRPLQAVSAGQGRIKAASMKRSIKLSENKLQGIKQKWLPKVFFGLAALRIRPFVQQRRKGFLFYLSAR